MIIRSFFFKSALSPEPTCNPPWLAVVSHLIRHTLQGSACLTHTPRDCGRRGRRRRRRGGRGARRWTTVTKCCSRRWERNNKLFWRRETRTEKTHESKSYRPGLSVQCVKIINSHVLLLGMHGSTSGGEGFTVLLLSGDLRIAIGWSHGAVK